MNIGRTAVGDYLRRPLPDWPLLHRELKRPGVTRSLLWEEYPAVHREGYGYSRFFDLYRNWRGQLAPTMRQTHVTGDKLFGDYADATADVTGEPTFADAILDRIVSNAHRINFDGPSMQKTIAKNFNANDVDHAERK